jgi:hypothetical protein
MINEVDGFIVSHFNLAAGIFAIVAVFLKLIWDGKSNGIKLDTVINETKNMQVEFIKYGAQVSVIAKDVTDIKHDTRSHDKEISSINARLATVEHQVKTKN